MRPRTRSLLAFLVTSLALAAVARAEDDETTRRVRAAVIRPRGVPAPTEKPDHEADVRRDYPALQRIRTIKIGYASAYTPEGEPVVLEKNLFSKGWSVSSARSLWCLADLFRDRSGMAGTTKLGDGSGQGLPVLSRSGKSVRFHVEPPSGPARTYLMSWAGKEGLEYRRDRTVRAKGPAPRK